MTKMIKKEVTIMIQKANFERCELDGAGCQIIFSSGMLKIRGNIFKKTAPGTSTCRACGNKIKKVMCVFLSSTTLITTTRISLGIAYILVTFTYTTNVKLITRFT